MPRSDDLESLAASVMMTGFPGTSVDEETRAMIERGVRSFILFARNVTSGEGVRALCEEIRHLAGVDALIGIDHEGGRVNRLRGVVTAWPSPMGWAATGDENLVRRASGVMAGELSALGINLNFAPVADLLGNYRNPVLGTRCFSDDPADSSRYVAAFVEGHRRAGVAMTAKHFPGHGDTPVDSHVDLPEVARTRERLLGEDIVPFRAAIAAGVDAIMISHVWYSRLDGAPTPATLSPAVARLAREDLGYDGPIVTDSLEMGAIQSRMDIGEAVVGALCAGSDLVMVSHGTERQRQALTAIAEAAQSEVLPPARLDDARNRIAGLRSSARYGTAMPAEGESLAREIAQRGVTLVRNERNTIPLGSHDADQLGVLTFSASRASQAEEESSQPPLASALAARYPGLVQVSVREDETPEGAAARLGEVDTVIAGTAHAVGRTQQAETVNLLLDAGKRVIVVALGAPFDLLAVPRVPAFLAAYSDVPASVEVAAEIIAGQRRAQGHLPVEIPGLYPRYHGL